MSLTPGGGASRGGDGSQPGNTSGQRADRCLAVDDATRLGVCVAVSELWLARWSWGPLEEGDLIIAGLAWSAVLAVAPVMRWVPVVISAGVIAWMAGPHPYMGALVTGVLAIVLGRWPRLAGPVLAAVVLVLRPALSWWPLALAGLMQQVRTRRGVWGVLAVGLALAALPARSVPAVPSRDIILITVDTLRADVAAELTVTRDIARRGVTYPSAWTNAPWTRPALRSLFGGEPSARHESSWTPELTLAEVAVQEGYSPVAAQAGNPFAAQGTWGHRGFFRVMDPRERVDDALPADVSSLSRGRPWLARLWRREPWRGEADLLVDRAIHALRTTPGPRFLWLHLMDVHLPYTSAECRPEVLTRVGAREAILADPWWLTEEGQSCWRSSYRAAAARVDVALQRLIAAAPGALIVLTADHGEALGDAGVEHGHTAAAPVSRIPLVVSDPWPHTAMAVDLVDLGTTLAAVMGASDFGEGRDLRGNLAAREIEIGPALYGDVVGHVGLDGRLSVP